MAALLALQCTIRIGPALPRLGRGRIALVCGECEALYHRPHSSKAYLEGTAPARPVLLAAAFLPSSEGAGRRVRTMHTFSIACMSRFRFVVLTVEALRPGAFEWVLFESFDDMPGFEPFARSDISFPTYESAWEAGCAALQSCMEDPKPDLLDDQD